MGRLRVKVSRTCETCGTPFMAYPAQIAQGLGRYCSKECFYGDKSRLVECVCKRCGKSFAVTPSAKANGGGNYCSKECRHPEHITVTCGNCGKHIAITSSKTKFKTHYCSKECHNEARRKALLRVDKICEYCKKPFQTIPARQERSKYCSVECQHLGQREIVEVKCAYCGQSFTDFPSKIKAGRRFCSNTCVTAANDKRVEVNCKFCGKPFLAQPFYLKKGQGLYCSRDCAGQGNSGSGNWRFRGGGRVNRGPNWRRQRRLAYQRDGGICQRCGKKPKKGESQFHVHHIVAYRDFNGDYLAANDLLNLITLCPSCHPRAELGLVYVPKRLF